MNKNKWNAGPQSVKLFKRAKEMIPGGVNSPVRAFNAVGGQPFFVQKAKGAKIWDADGNEYIDFMSSWGPLILGHAHDEVIAAVVEAAQRGTSYGAPHEAEVELAAAVVDAMPTVEMVRMVNSGTEATMSAIRLARGYTEKPKVIKFEGCYHGHADSFLIKAGSGAATFGVPDSPGVTKATVSDTLIASYNDLNSVAELFELNKENVAAVIVEPVAGNMGCILPAKGFLEGLRDLCDRYGALLIFDEVITGFRIALGGAQEHYKVKADLTTMGKVLGGGLPVGAYGGKKEIMKKISPTGPVYQAGTLSGNPLAMAAGIAMLKQLRKTENLYDKLDRLGATMEKNLIDASQAAGIDLTVNRVGSMMGFFFNKGPVETWSDVEKSNTDMFKTFFQALLARGISIAPSAFEVLFVNTAHTTELLEQTRKALFEAFEQVGQKG